jgi:hypothetical protein
MDDDDVLVHPPAEPGGPLSPDSGHIIPARRLPSIKNGADIGEGAHTDTMLCCQYIELAPQNWRGTRAPGRAIQGQEWVQKLIQGLSGLVSD